MCHKFLVLTVKKLLKSVYICRSYRKIKTGVSLFWTTLYMQIKENSFFDDWREQWLRKYLPVHNLFINGFISKLTLQILWITFWWFVCWWALKLQHKVKRFCDRLRTFIQFFSRFFTFLTFLKILLQLFTSLVRNIVLCGIPYSLSKILMYTRQLKATGLYNIIAKCPYNYYTGSQHSQNKPTSTVGLYGSDGP